MGRCKAVCASWWGDRCLRLGIPLACPIKARKGHPRAVGGHKNSAYPWRVSAIPSILVVGEPVIVCQQYPTYRAVALTVLTLGEYVAATIETVEVIDNGISEGYRVPGLQQLYRVREVEGVIVASS